MKKVNDIFKHSKGVVTHLQWVGENPKDMEYSIWLNDLGETVEVFNEDLKTPFMYSTLEYDMNVRAVKWLRRAVDNLDDWFDDNSR